MRRIVGSLLTLVALLLSWSAVAAGAKAYVGNFKDNSVSVIDLGTGTVVATVPVSSGPHGMSATPDGRTVYVTEVDHCRLVQFRVDRPGLAWQRWKG